MPDDYDDNLARLTSALEVLLNRLGSLPAPLRRKVEENLRQLRGLIQEKRNPRVMLVGRRGSGKSVLINALFGAPARPVGSVRAQTGSSQWEVCEYNGRKMEILDTRGVQEGSRPAEEDEAATPIASLLTAVGRTAPDVILFAVKAKEVDAAIKADLSALVAVQRAVQKVHGLSPTIIPVLTQCDELDPRDQPLPTTDSLKIANIEAAVSVLNEHLQEEDELRPFLIDVVPVVGLMYFEPTRDYRWNIDTLVLKIFEHLPDESQIEFSRVTSFRAVQTRLAKTMVNAACSIATIIGLEPIPVVDMPLLTSLQAAMVVAIAYISGEEMSSETARGFIRALGVNVAAGMAFREAARALIKLLPAYGSAVSGGVAAAGTKIVGEAAIAFYIEARQLEDVRAEFERGIRGLWKR